jgi:hypothetical protein
MPTPLCGWARCRCSAEGEPKAPGSCLRLNQLVIPALKQRTYHPTGFQADKEGLRDALSDR